MANYLHLATNTVKSESQIRNENPQTSYPASFPVPEGYALVFPAPQPAHDPITQSVRGIAPKLINGHYEQDYEIVALDAATIAANQARASAQAREAAKSARTKAVEAITVTTSAGHTFDGDETSQTRMVRAIVALQATATPSITWVLANNTAIQATAAELTEALALAGAAQAAVWVV